MTPSDFRISRDFIDRLQAITSLSPSFWQEFHEQAKPGASPTELRVKESLLSLLTSELEISAESILTENVDFRALAAHHSGNTTLLPERYTRGSGRIRTSAHLFDRIELLQGWRARQRLIRKLQVTEAIIGDPELTINVQFITDVCDEMAKMGIRDDQFFQMGCHSAIRNYHTIVGQKFRETRSVREMYERCFHEVAQEHYDQNSIYELVYSDHDRVIIKVRPNPDVCDQLGTLWIGSLQTCANRAGAFASLPGYAKLPFSEVHETRCIHRGDPACIYEVIFRARDITTSSSIDQAASV